MAMSVRGAWSSEPATAACYGGEVGDRGWRTERGARSGDLGAQSWEVRGQRSEVRSQRSGCENYSFIFEKNGSFCPVSGCN